jgi:hypothetical protein
MPDSDKEDSRNIARNVDPVKMPLFLLITLKIRSGIVFLNAS